MLIPRMWERTTLRVRILAAGGVAAIVTSASEPESGSFALLLAPIVAARLGSFVEREVTAELRLLRGEDGQIVEGEILDFEPLAEGDAFELWRAWFRENASGWNDVADIEAELGRGEL